MMCVFPKGIQFTQELQTQPKNTHSSDHSCIAETSGFAGKQDESNRIRGFELSVSVSQHTLWVSLTVFSPPVQRRGVQIALHCGEKGSLTINRLSLSHLIPLPSLQTGCSLLLLCATAQGKRGNADL